MVIVLVIYVAVIWSWTSLVCVLLEESPIAFGATVEMNVVINVEVIGGGIPLLSNSIQPFGEHAVAFGQHPPPVTVAHSKVNGGQSGGRVADGWHSESRASLSQQNVPEELYVVAWQVMPTGQQMFCVLPEISAFVG